MELKTGIYIVLGLLIVSEVIYRVVDWVLFRANNLTGEMEEEE